MKNLYVSPIWLKKDEMELIKPYDFKNINVMDISMISQLLLCTAVYVDFKLKIVMWHLILDISVTKDWSK